MILFIDLQLGSLCNRDCWFCPQQSIFKPLKDEYADNSFLIHSIKFIKDGLTNNKIHKNFYFCLNRYFEPLLYTDVLITAINMLKKEFPNTIIEMHTNGDLISIENLEVIKLLDIVHINRYDDDLLQSKLYLFKHFKIRKIEHIKIKNTLKFKYFNTYINLIYNKESFFVNNKLINNRGSAIKKLNSKIKNNICTIPGKILCIDINGDIFPCCDLHSNVLEHRITKVGSIYENNCNEVYDKMKSFNSLVYDCCKYCNSKYEFIKYLEEDINNE